MKKIYSLLILSFMAFGIAEAQDVFSMRDTVVKGEFPGGDSLFYKIKTYADNSTAKEITLDWTVVKTEGPEQWEFQLCDNGLCYEVEEGSKYETYGFSESCIFEGGVNPKGAVGAGSMQVDVTHSSDETKVATVIYQWDFVLGVGMIQKVSFELFPNPAQSNLTINFSNKDFGQNVDVKVFNLLGQAQSGVKIIQSPESITADVKGLRNGTYLVQLITEDGETVTQRFTKRN